MSNTKTSLLEKEIDKIFSIYEEEDFLEKYRSLKKREFLKKHQDIELLLQSKTSHSLSLENREKIKEKIETKILHEDFGLNFGRLFFFELKKLTD